MILGFNGAPSGAGGGGLSGTATAANVTAVCGSPPTPAPGCSVSPPATAFSTYVQVFSISLCCCVFAPMVFIMAFDGDAYADANRSYGFFWQVLIHNAGCDGLAAVNRNCDVS